MTGQGPDQSKLSTAEQLLIDRHCSRFEEQIREHADPPRIESFVEAIDEHLRPALLWHLLLLELEYRGKDSPPPAQEYYARFPQYVGQLDLIFAAAEDFPATEDAAPRVDAPIQVGPYKLLQQIGKGGMGEVWMADQLRPVTRRVAIKLIHPELISRHAIARFEAERQALSMMDHPNIAKVLDAGETSDGRPYFAMELVRGIPLTEYCNRNRLTPRERLELVIPICQAIQHAHQKGVIHRDIKPTNILVALTDGKPVPKVIDFGLAKALQVRLTDKTLYTEFGKVVGTLNYMSPEQAELDNLSVDARTDIYSLGILLYELLTGSTPIDRKTIESLDVLALLHLIRDEEPPRPSQRLTASGDAMPGISQERRIEPLKLQKMLQGDLDWIVMKALEKDRARRYASAAALADDLQRFLDNDPVEARPPSATYRLQKLVRKHRGRFAAAVAFLLLLIGSSVALSVMAWNLSRSEAAARKNFAAARGMAVEVVTIAENGLSGLKGQGTLREAVMDNCYATMTTLHEAYRDDRNLAHDFVKIAVMTSNVKRSLGKYDEAGTIWRKARDVTQTYLSGFPDDLEVGKTSIEVWREGVTLHKAVGDLTAAEYSLQHAMKSLNRLAGEATSRSELALLRGPLSLEQVGLEIALGRPEEALSAADQCLSAYQSLTPQQQAMQAGPAAGPGSDHRPVRLLAVARRGQLLHQLGRSEEARRVLATGIELANGFIEATPETAGNLYYGLARLLNYSADASPDAGPAEHGLEQIGTAIEVWTALANATDIPGFRFFLGEAWRIRGRLEEQSGDIPAALEAYEHSREVLSSLVSDDPIPENFDALAETLGEMTRFHQQQDDDSQAATALKEALRWERSAIAASPLNQAFVRRLADLEQRQQKLNR